MFQKTEERSVAVAVRLHKTLELADDKFYMITCGKAGFQNNNNRTSLVTLQMMREGKRVQQVIYGREYKLRRDTAVILDFRLVVHLSLIHI